MNETVQPRQTLDFAINRESGAKSAGNSNSKEHSWFDHRKFSHSSREFLPTAKSLPKYHSEIKLSQAKIIQYFGSWDINRNVFHKDNNAKTWDYKSPRADLLKNKNVKS